MIADIEIEPVLISWNFLYQVSQYLRGDVPLDYLRRWEVDMFLSRHTLNNAEIGFVHRFEGIYADYTTMLDSSDEQVRDKALPVFRRRLHQAVCGWQQPPYETGSSGTCVSAVQEDGAAPLSAEAWVSGPKERELCMYIAGNFDPRHVNALMKLIIAMREEVHAAASEQERREIERLHGKIERLNEDLELEGFEIESLFAQLRVSQARAESAEAKLREVDAALNRAAAENVALRERLTNSKPDGG